jgi:hypothetical protein
MEGMWSLYRHVGDEPINEYEDQSLGEVNQYKMDTMIFSPEVHMLASTLRPRCVDHHFMVWRLIGNPKPNSPRPPQETTASEVTQWHEQFTRATLRRFVGEDATPLTRSLEPATNNHQHVSDLHHCSKLSRWWQPPRETRSQRSPKCH